MLNNYRIVTITPVGRRKYIDLLYPYLLQNRDIIDQHIWWINTNDTYDISHVYSLTCKHKDFFSINFSKDAKFFASKSGIANIYSACNDKQTIYIKISDDICWIHPDAIKELVQFRLDNLEYFAIYPFVNNTNQATAIMQLLDLMAMNIMEVSPVVVRKKHISLSDFHPIIAENIHTEFLALIESDRLLNIPKLLPRVINFDYSYIPDHSLCWFGKDFTTASRPEEIYKAGWVSQIESKDRNRPTCICPSSWMSHFSYGSQEDYLLSKTSIFDLYKSRLPKE